MFFVTLQIIVGRKARNLYSKFKLVVEEELDEDRPTYGLTKDQIRRLKNIYKRPEVVDLN